MTIKFICSCGKHLKARDEMAARRSVCPRCGSPVGIPSLNAGRQGPAPMTPQERLRHARNRKPLPGATPPPATAPSTDPSDTPSPADRPAAAPRPIDPRVIRLLSSRGKRRPELKGRHLEERWQEFLLYPLRAWRFCVVLAVLLTLLGSATAVFLPLLLAEPPDDPLTLGLVRLACVLLLVLLLGLPCSFLECVLTSAAAGEVYYLLWSGNPLVTVVRSGAKWLACFLAGPLVFATAAWVYWLNCGDPEVVDWLILTELGVVAVAYWLFALLAVTDHGRLRDLNPLAVGNLAHRLGWRGLGVVVAAALVFLAHGLVLITGTAEVHDAVAKGFLILAAGWTSGLFWSTFFCRLLGVWCHRSRHVTPAMSD